MFASDGWEDTTLGNVGQATNVGMGTNTRLSFKNMTFEVSMIATEDNDNLNWIQIHLVVNVELKCA